MREKKDERLKNFIHSKLLLEELMEIKVYGFKASLFRDKKTFMPNVTDFLNKREKPRTPRDLLMLAREYKYLIRGKWFLDDMSLNEALKLNKSKSIKEIPSFEAGEFAVLLEELWPPNKGNFIVNYYKLPAHIEFKDMKEALQFASMVRPCSVYEYSEDELKAIVL